ncbi:Uncharacterised protein [Segatella copri]|nr:Uncharacterised protein [Segatella copri]
MTLPTKETNSSLDSDSKLVFLASAFLVLLVSPIPKSR